jgi:voltage-gated potassium channel
MSAISFPAAGERQLVRAPILDLLDRLLGPTFFFLAVAFLILAAGVCHRLSHTGFTGFEADVLFWGLVLLWPVFVLEGVLRLLACRRPGSGFGQRLVAFAGLCFFPAIRLGGRAYADSEKIWLPGLGLVTVDGRLRGRLERLISVPMIIIASLMLPLLAMEYFWLEQVRSQFALSLVLDIGTSVVWLAFALEFIVMVSVANDRTRYCLQHWLDLAVVCLPLVDFLPILRLLRLSEFLELQQLGRLSRLYRLRGLLARTWRAVLLLEMIQRLRGRYCERHLQRLKESLRACQDEMAALQEEIAEIEKRLAGGDKSALPGRSLER